MAEKWILLAWCAAGVASLIAAWPEGDAPPLDGHLFAYAVILTIAAFIGPFGWLVYLAERADRKAKVAAAPVPDGGEEKPGDG